MFGPFSGVLIDTYDHSIVHVTPHNPARITSKPPGPKADKRRLWDNSESGLCWSMNSDNLQEPKNSFWIAAQLLGGCWWFVVVSRYRYLIRSRTFRLHLWKFKTHLAGKQFTNGTNPTVSKVVDIIHATNTFCKVKKQLISAKMSAELQSVLCQMG